MWPELSCLDRLLAGITFATMVKALCMAGNVLVQISPYPQVQRWELRGSTGEADAAPYVSICFGGWQWCYYGLFAFLITKRSGFLVLVHSNVLGAVLGTYYTVAFYRNCKNDLARQSLQKYLTAVSTLIFLQVTTIATLPVERALFLTGLISSFCSFVGAISMLASVPTVIRTKDSRSIPGPLVLANMLSAAVWCLCGWILSDPLISAPNIVGCATSGVCLYLKNLYPDGSCKDKDDSGKMSKADFADSEAAFEAMAKLPKKLEGKLELTDPSPMASATGAADATDAGRSVLEAIDKLVENANDLEEHAKRLDRLEKVLGDVAPKRAVRARQNSKELQDEIAQLMNENLEKAFKQFDTDSSGALDAEELRAAYQATGRPISDEKLSKCVKMLDKDGDGLIDLAEFKEIAIKSQML